MPQAASRDWQNTSGSLRASGKAIRAKLKYTTLIELPTTEKVMQAATGDKEFWIVDVVGNFCFVHPAKQGISSNLNLITDNDRLSEQILFSNRSTTVGYSACDQRVAGKDSKNFSYNKRTMESAMVPFLPLWPYEESITYVLSTR